MSQKTNRTTIGLAFKEAPPASIDAGAVVLFAVSVEWPEGSSAEGATYKINNRETVIQSGALPPAAEDGTVSFSLIAPEEIGDHRCVLMVSAPGRQKDAHAEGALPFVLTAISHTTSLAVWDVPSPVVRGSAFEVRVGAKCSAACDLAGRDIEILDEDGKTAGRGVLGAAPWEGTSSLYWTTIRLKAPRRLNLHSWSVHFPSSELKLAHGGTLSRFSFTTVAEPEHSVSVKVVNRETKAPIAKAQVRLGLYRAQTDATGIAKVNVPKGEFALIVTRAGFDIPDRLIRVAKDVRVQIPAAKLPEEDPFAAWTA